MALMVTSAPQLLETPQAAPSQESKRAWFLQGAGLAALMLVGVYSMGGLGHHDGAAPSGYEAALAFQPALRRGISTGGLRSVRAPVMTAGHEVHDTSNARTTAFVNSPKGKQQATRKPMSLASRQQYLAERVEMNSMSMLATAALESAGDERQLASVFSVMPEEDVAKVEELKEEVVEKVKELTVNEKARAMAGVSGPLGFFDPVGFCTDCTEGKLCFYREVEVKHGRVAMLASLGFLVGESFHPLFGGNIDVPSYIAFQQTPLQTFWPAVMVAIAIPEVFSVFSFQEPSSENDSLWAIKTKLDNGMQRVPGDLGFDPMGLKPQDEKGLKEMQTKELNNGRLAMIAAAGMVAQELASGQKILR